MRWRALSLGLPTEYNSFIGLCSTVQLLNNGGTEPKDAEAGTVRKLYADNKGENIVHGSDSVENGSIEIGFFFSSKELIES